MTNMAQPPQADIETSSESYAQRFTGPAGEWLLATQTRLLLDLLRDRPQATVLDVGGGHAQSAGPLAEAGHSVHVLGSDSTCATRLHDLIAAHRIQFHVGDTLNLPFPDNSFDVAISLRLVPHCEDWPRLLAELCRVATDTVIIDYPCLESFNCLANLFFERKKRMEGNTRTWITFRHQQIRAVFQQLGWSDLTSKKQFFWPMVIHRQLNRPGLSTWLEAGAAGLGLRRILGSPVLLRARPAPEQ